VHPFGNISATTVETNLCLSRSLLRLPVQLVIVATRAIMQEAANGDKEIRRFLNSITQRCWKMIRYLSPISRPRKPV